MQDLVPCTLWSWPRRDATAVRVRGWTQPRRRYSLRYHSSSGRRGGDGAATGVARLAKMSQTQSRADAEQQEVVLLDKLLGTCHREARVILHLASCTAMLPRGHVHACTCTCRMRTKFVFKQALKHHCSVGNNNTTALLPAGPRGQRTIAPTCASHAPFPDAGAREGAMMDLEKEVTSVSAETDARLNAVCQHVTLLETDVSAPTAPSAIR